MSKACQPGESLWEITADMPGMSGLDRDMTADVCVVGAGIAGMSTAYLLAREGRSVIVVDSGAGGGGETRYTTAHLASAIDDRFVEVERIRGREFSRLAAQSHAAAIDQIENIVNSERIDCDFERLDGYLFEPSSEDGSKTIDSELEAARRAGLEGVLRLDHAPWPHFRTGPCLLFPRQGQFHPLRYVKGLMRGFHARGGRVFTRTRVARIESGDPATVHTHDGRKITAQHVVVATNSPINNLVAIHTKQAPYMTYAFAAEIPRGSIPAGLYWDTLDPYHYVRLQSGQAAIDSLGTDRAAEHELIIVGGEDHKTGQATDQLERFMRLESWARERFPRMGQVIACWSGQVLETFDGLGFIGRNPGDLPNVYIATGDSGMGMTHGAIAGILITDLVQGRANPWTELYDPARKPLKTAWEFTKENLNVAAQYTDWVTPGDVKSVDDIPRGKGAIVRRGLKKIAVYRDDFGSVREMSATCTHLDCVVHWNDAEKTWDCPCHGSRFNKEGKVTHGPAVADLAEIGVPETAAKE